MSLKLKFQKKYILYINVLKLYNIYCEVDKLMKKCECNYYIKRLMVI